MKTPTPSVLFTGSRSGAWNARLIAPREVANRIGEDVLAAFMKCFLGVDRILTFEQLMHFNHEKLDSESPAGLRNNLVLFLLIVATLYELRDALQQLCSAQVAMKMEDRSAWEPLNQMLKRIRKSHLTKELRNQAGHHLGDRETHHTGLAYLLEQDEVMLCSVIGDKRHGGAFVGAWDALLRGLEIDEDKLVVFVETTWTEHTNFPDQLMAAFQEVLRSAGIAFENRLTEET